MAFNDGTELTIQVDARQGNAEVNEFNRGLDRMEQAALRSTRVASGGFDRMERAAVDSRKELVTLGRSGIQAVEDLEDQVVRLARESVTLRGRLLENREAQEALNAAQRAGNITAGEHATRVRILAIQENQLEQSLRKTSLAHGAARQDLRALKFQAQDAGGELSILASSLGIHLPAAVTQLLTRLQSVQGIIKLAFPAVLITAFLGILALIPEGIRKITDSLAGWTEAARRHFEELQSQNQEIIKQNREIEIQQIALARSAAGLAGVELKVREGSDLRKELGLVAAAAADAQGEIQRLVSENQKLRGRLAPLGGFLPTFRSVGGLGLPVPILVGPEAKVLRGTAESAAIREQIEFNDKRLGTLRKTLDELTAKQIILQKLTIPKAEIEAHQEINKLVEERRKLLADLQISQRQTSAETLAAAQKEFSERLTLESDLFNQRLAFDNERDRQGVQNLRQFQQAQIDIARDTQLRQLELIEPQTIEQKVAFEGRKAEIEIEHAQRTHAIRMSLFMLETDAILLEQRLRMQALGFSADEIERRLVDLTSQRDLLKERVDMQARAAQDATRENAAIRQAQIIVNENQRIFQSLKQQAGGVLDALLDKSTSVWQAIANTFKATMLTAIKDVASSWIANILLPIFGVGGAGRGGFGGARAGTASVLGGILPGVFGGGIPGIGPGGTPPFIPGPVGGGVGGGSAGGFAGFGAANLASLKSFLGLGGRTAAGGIGPTLPFGQMGLGGKLSAIGKSDAALFAGAALALDGIRRGGALGLAETTGGGALIGFRFGGPVGAVVGAVIGFGIGLVGLFRKSPEDKIREAIRKMYGVEIRDKALLRQLFEMAKPFGSIELAIAQPQLRELIQLYSLMTDQRGAFPAQMRPVALGQSGGRIFELPNFGSLGSSQIASSVGARSVSGDRLSSTERPAPAAQSIGPIVVNITVPGAREFFEKETVRVVVENPRVISEAVNSGMRASAGRREATALQLKPGLIVS